MSYREQSIHKFCCLTR